MIEIFHRVSDPASAQVRRYLTEHDLVSQVRIRNLAYPEVQADFVARGGKEAPALWDGEVLYEGAEQVISQLILKI